MIWTKDQQVSPHAEIIGEVKLGRDTEIGAFSVVGFDPSRSRSRFHAKSLNIPKELSVSIGNNVTIGSHCVIETGVTIADGCYIDHGCFIGADTKLEEGVFLRYRAEVYRRVALGARSIVGGFICNDVVLGEECDFFGTCVHNYIGAARGMIEPSPNIGNRVFVGFNAVIVGPVTIPDNAVIKAGTVVSEHGSDPIDTPAQSTPCSQFSDAPSALTNMPREPTP